MAITKVYKNNSWIPSGGGVTVYNGTGTIPHNYSGSEVNTSTKILEINNLPQGKYLLFGYLTVDLGSSKTGQMYINLKHNGTALVFDLNMFTSRASYYKTISYCFEGSGAITLELDSNQSSTVRGSLIAWKID